MSSLPPYPATLAFGFATGLFFGPINPITNIATQERTPTALRGRVVGAIAWPPLGGRAPLGYLVAGPLVQGLGLPATLLVLAAALTLACGVGAALPALRGLDDPPLVRATTHPDLKTLNPDQRLPEAQELARGRGHRTDNDAERTNSRTSEPLRTARRNRAPARAVAGTETA